MPNVLKRRTTGISAAVLAGLLGAGIGYFFGQVQTRHRSEIRLTEAAQTRMAPFVTLTREANLLLATLDKSSLQPCSHDELALFRQKLFSSETLHDLGRIQDGHLACSAIYGGEQLHDSIPEALLTRPDGLILYRNVYPYLSPSQTVYFFARNGFYVVEDPTLNSRWPHANIYMEGSMLDEQQHLMVRPHGTSTQYPAAIRNRDSIGFIGDTHYVTICSPKDYFCVSAFESYRDALWNNRVQIASETSAGGIIGLLSVWGIYLFLAYNRSLPNQLLRAIQTHQIRMVYQPIAELGSGHVVAVEALARWTDEAGYAVSPEIFVRVAEERGLINRLTRYIIERSLTEFAAFLQTYPEFRLHINVSALDLQDDYFLVFLNDILGRFKLAPRSVIIEITESQTALKQKVGESIDRLRQAGFSTYIDDFGTGYSSLAYLKDLAIHAIKIDKAFTQSIGTEAVTLSLLPQMLAMAETLSLQVVVEGIETVEQAAYFANKQPALLGQGWLYGRPAPAQELLAQWAKRELAVHPTVQ
jgi:sensor c-di-GMP phosphodiesterase-like protein